MASDDASSPNENFTPGSALEPALSRSFGFDDDVDAWVKRVAEAVREPSPEELGTIAGYRLLSVVARGGQGTVYRAVEPGTERTVAVKRLHQDGGGTSARARFDREAEIVASLQHPGIVTLLARHESGEQRILVMEWIDGKPLDRWADELRASGVGGSQRTIVRSCVALAEAIAHAHRNGVIHRDLKPSNVLVDQDGQPHVLDFGLALPFGGDATVITQASGFLGTPSYAAPEQVQARHVDARADVHAVGALLYRALTGSHPFDETASLPELFRQITETDPAPPSRVVSGIGRDLSLVCMKALAKEPDRRYESMDALAADLRRWLANEPVLAHPNELRYVLGKAIARHRLAFGTAMVAMVLLLGATFISTWLALSLSVERENLLNSKAEEQIAKVAAEAGAREATRRAHEAERSRESAERARDFLQGIFTAMREAGLEDSRISAQSTLELARNMLSLEDRPAAIEGELRETLGGAFDELGDAAAAAEEYRRAETLLAGSPDADLDVLAHAQLGLGKQLVALTMFLEAQRPLAAAAEWYRMNGDDSRCSEALRLLATARKAISGPTAALPLAEEAVEMALRSGDGLRTGSAMSTVALFQEELGFAAEAFETSRNGVDCLRERVHDRHPELARALHNHAYLGLLVSRFPESVAAARESIAIRESNYGPRAVATVGTFSVLVRAMAGAGQRDQAIELGREFIDAIADSDAHRSRYLSLCYFWLRVLEDRKAQTDWVEIAERTRPLVDESLRLEGASGSRTVDLIRVRVRTVSRLEGPSAIRAMLRDEPQRWAMLTGENELAPALARLGILLGCSDVRALPPAELLVEAETLAPTLESILAPDAMHRLELLRMLGDVRELGGDLLGSLQARRAAVAIATARAGPDARGVVGLRRAIARLEEMASR